MIGELSVMDQAAQKVIDRQIEQELSKHLVVQDGVRVRGTVTRVRCECGVFRFNDGTRCNACGSRYFQEVEEDSRL